MIQKEKLEFLYITRGKSMQEIACIFRCSVHKIRYWINQYGIKVRSISEAIYIKNNPDGDPFKFLCPKTIKDAELYGYGLGLYSGEGTKADKTSVRLGNSNPIIIKKFMEFLIKIFGCKKRDFKYGLQLFTDINEKEALDFWYRMLKIDRGQFYKVSKTISGSIGTYRSKNQYGVLTIYYHNKKLRDLLINMLPR